MWLLLAAAGALQSALASPDTPAVLILEHHLRTEAVPWLAGSPDRGGAARAEALALLESDSALRFLARDFDPEGLLTEPGEGWRDMRWFARPWAGLGLLGLAPVGAKGDTEPGLFSPRGGLELTGYLDDFEIFFSPEVRLEAPGSEDPVEVQLPVTEYYVGWRGDLARVGFGARTRVFGPGRRGSLTQFRDAQPHPAGSAAMESKGRFGHWRGEIGAGWLPLPREDVALPGLLHMDLRYAPFPLLELGLSRIGLFGGKGRPTPTLGELLLPLDPHVANDPDQLLPDQDELAALDGRLLLPLGSWWPNGPDYLEFWYQYGGEDMIVRDVLGLPFPSLAGVANLYGAELSWKGVSLTVERAEIMDDTFRWYTGHRIYHQGFTQDGQFLGHPSGGDSDTLWFDLKWVWGPLGIESWVERRHRIGVVDVIEGHVISLPEEEWSQRGGLRAWRLLPQGGHVVLGAELSRIEGEDFVPGAENWYSRIWLAWRGPLQIAARPG